jgi:4-amino-4-deoxy-L-arabinose transferase-like glycosyltransferase
MPFLTTPLAPTSTPTLAKLGCAGVCLLWLLAGNLGHDLWKADDAIHLGIAFEMVKGNWLVPSIAGEPWVTSPPLYHWLAALSGQLFGHWLAWHEAARLASALLGGAFLGGLALTAQRLTGASASLAAPFLAIGTLGFVVPLHDANPVAGSLAGWSLALLGLSLVRNHTFSAGTALGAGIGVSFLSAGVPATILPLLTGLALLLQPTWRMRSYSIAWLLALLIAAIIMLPWPWLLHQTAPDLFSAWWSQEWSRRPLTEGFSRNHFELLAWASWPVLPLAFWTLWLERKRLNQAHTFLPLTGTLVALSMFFVGDPKEVAILPSLVPMTLLAANGAGRLRRGAANAFDWFGMMTLTLLCAILWLGGISILTGEPQRVAKNFTIPAPEFVAQLSIPLLTLAIAVTVAWIAVMTRTPRSPWRAAARWSVGLTTVWVLLATLLLPWIDHLKSYRSVSATLRAALAADSRKSSRLPDCIVRKDLGLAHRASLDYYDGIRTVVESTRSKCRYLLVQTEPKSETALPGWMLIADPARPADKSERLRLYRKN